MTRSAPPGWPTRITVLGNPENRRVARFAAAAAAAGLPDPVLLPWRAAAAGRIAVDPDTVLRIDSPGENAEVDRLLRGAVRRAEFGEIIGLGAAYRGMCRVLRAVTATGVEVLNAPRDIEIMCDKRRCHGTLRAAGVPVPEALPPVAGPIDGYAGLRAGLRAVGWSRVFVKPANGSSASGVIALTLGRPGQVSAITPVEAAGDRLFNSLRVRRYRSEAEVAMIVDQLAPDGLHVERWYPKATLAGRPADLRVVVIAGQPTHAVVRLGQSPMTNLHLGGTRGDLAALRAATGAAGWAAAMETCVRVAGCFRGSLQVAVDLMFHRRWTEHAVAEVNAFGDLLPGLLVAGRDTYAQQLHALRSGTWAAWRSTRHTGMV